MLSLLSSHLCARGRGLSLSAGHILRLTTVLSTHCFSSGSGFYDTLMNIMASSKAVTIAPKDNHTATVFFLHGLGDTGHGWAAGFEDIQEGYIKYSCPNAPIQPVTLNAGMRMPSWFDITSLNFQGPEDEEGLKKSSNQLKTLIAEEEKLGIPAERIVIGGFSQGGAVALYTALTMDKKIGGCIILSSWLPLHQKIKDEIKGNKSYPVFQGHGNADPVVNFNFGMMTSTELKKIFSNYTFNTYAGMGHSSSPKEMKDVKEFLQKALPKM